MVSLAFPLPLDFHNALLAQVDGDSTVELELASALREKNSNFRVRDLGRLAMILDAHRSNIPIQQPGTMDISNIQQDAFDLVMRQMDYDCKAFKVWQGKMKNYDSAPPPFHHLLPWSSML